MIGHHTAPADLPTPYPVQIPGRGTTNVWDSGPAFGNTPLVLLHGWNIDAPTNFGFAFSELAQSRRVVMFDHHGHGNGVRTSAKFTLEDAAADVVSVLDALSIDRAIIVGYSMGGTIAQLVAREAPNRCEALVLAATAATFCTRARERAMFASFAIGARTMRRLPRRVRRAAFDRLSAAACANYPEWIRDAVQMANPAHLLEAGAALGKFDSREWAPTLDVPTALIVTIDDTVVPTRRQIDLAQHVGPMFVDMVAADHALPVNNDKRYATAIASAANALEDARPRTFA